MRDKDSLILENLYYYIIEGKRETIDYLQNNGADQDTITFFTKLDTLNKPIFSTDQAIIMFNWIKNNPVNFDDIEKDYLNFKKYFPNKNLNIFKDYLNFSETVHAKVGEKDYENRNKDLNSINVQGEDKENVIEDNEEILILKGDNEHRCVKYGKGYSFCISRPHGGNMYGNYRVSKASTFYFIFFKKVPKEDPKHIMVLDRTKGGWEWTFANNKTQVIKGGWDEIIQNYPILEKYKDKFINIPLTNQESAFQQKLKLFVKNPNRKIFETFSYKEKADVLKFGMEIPEDLFDSLDNFLRNEYISTGPDLLQSNFDKLNENERERFFKVRKLIINETGFRNNTDIEVAKNDPELYEKYVKPSIANGIEQENSLKIKIDEDGVYNNSIPLRYRNFFHPLNLPELIFCKLGGLEVSAIDLELPNLSRCISLDIKNVRKLNLPSLRICGDIYANQSEEIDLPELRFSKSLHFEKAKIINLQNLERCEDIYANRAKKIIIERGAIQLIRSVPKDCEFIHPRENRESIESFKKYFAK